jgi:hypothetical protein
LFIYLSEKRCEEKISWSYYHSYFEPISDHFGSQQQIYDIINKGIRKLYLACK